MGRKAMAPGHFFLFPEPETFSSGNTSLRKLPFFFCSLEEMVVVCEKSQERQIPECPLENGER
jgi:hypothetical protein